MNALLIRLLNDEAGFIVSAELVLVASIAILTMVVGLTEVSCNISAELEDVGSAVGAINQSVTVQGLCGHMASTTGYTFVDNVDFCDRPNDIHGCINNGGEGAYPYAY